MAWGTGHSELTKDIEQCYGGFVFVGLGGFPIEVVVYPIVIGVGDYTQLGQFEHLEYGYSFAHETWLAWLFFHIEIGRASCRERV